MEKSWLNNFDFFLDKIEDSAFNSLQIINHIRENMNSYKYYRRHILNLKNISIQVRIPEKFKINKDICCKKCILNEKIDPLSNYENKPNIYKNL